MVAAVRARRVFEWILTFRSARRGDAPEESTAAGRDQLPATAAPRKAISLAASM